MDYQTIYKRVAAKQVNYFYSNYQDHYKSISMDLSDLEQEIKLIIYKKLQEPNFVNMEEDEILKYITTLTQRTLIKFIRKSVKTNKICTQDGLDKLIQDPPSKDPSEILQHLKDEHKLSDSDYELLHKRFVEKKTFADIAKEFGINSSGIPDISGKIRRILRKYKLFDFIYTFVYTDEIDMAEQEAGYHNPIEYEGLMDDAKKLLSNKEFFVLNERITNELTFLQIAEIMPIEFRPINKSGQLTRQSVEHVYNRAINKIKKFLKKDLLF